jgi:hypothetical protein
MKNIFYTFVLLLAFHIQPGISQTEINQSVYRGDSAIYHAEPFGKSVFIFDPSMDMGKIQELIDTIYNTHSGRNSEFSENRVALMFKPGNYLLDVKVGYYMQVMGLGESPDDVVITGAVRSKARNSRKNVLTNFWRAVENLTVIPTIESANVWGVSQAAPMRRVHIKGNLQLHDGGYASGGFLADSKVDDTIQAGSQQQWFTRNSEVNKWEGGQWNILFMGVKGAPSTNWPEGPVTSLDKTPLIREKPYLVFKKGRYILKLPALRENTSGTSWAEGEEESREIPIEKFHIAKPGAGADEINAALLAGKNLILTPGIYSFGKSIRAAHAGSVIIGLGLATIVPTAGNCAMEIADVDEVTVAGLFFSAGETNSEMLMQVGEPGSTKDHSNKPAFLYDLFFRVGGDMQGQATNCLVINSSHVCLDHTWLWRADHGKGVAWEQNKAATGLLVNGKHVTVYGLFNEHFQEYQTIWNGDNGRMYFYQSEIPYDPPSNEAWRPGNIEGFASYKVSDKVTSHEAWGLGIYAFFRSTPVILGSAIEVPPMLEKDIHHKMTFWLNGNKESKVIHIINDKGETVDPAHRKAVMK